MMSNILHSKLCSWPPSDTGLYKWEDTERNAENKQRKKVMLIQVKVLIILYIVSDIYTYDFLVVREY